MEENCVHGWYRQFGPAVLRRAKTILGDEDAAKDVLQDVFVTAMDKSEELVARGVTMSWFYKVTTNRALNKIRNGKTRRGIVELVGKSTDDTRRAESSQQEISHTARRVLASLSDEMAEIAVYYYLDEMTQLEIANQLGCSRRNISHKLDELRNQLERAGWAA